MDLVSLVPILAASAENSFGACVARCAAFNDVNGSMDCEGVTFDVNLTADIEWNCFLKTSIVTRTPYTLDSLQASALLQ